MELNPNHPVTSAMREQWAKIAALLVQKLGGHAVITESDLLLAEGNLNVCVREDHEGLHVFTVDSATAQKLARSEGGLPQ